MRVLRVFDRYTSSGLSYFLIERIMMLNSDEFQMQVVYLDKQSGIVPVKYNGVRFHLLSEKIVKSISIPTVLKLVKLIKQEKIDIIHCDNYKGIFYGVLASLFCKDVKVMCLMHGMNRCRNWKRRLFFRLFASKVDKFLGCSKMVAEDIKTYPSVKSEQVAELTNSIDYERYASVKADHTLREKFGFGKDDFVFINVGRIVETKGLGYLLDAFRIVSKEYKNARLLIVGEGQLRSQLEMGAPDGVVFAGFRTDVGELMKVSDCFVLSSIREGFGIVLAEAMSVGVPAVTTETGAIEQVVDESGNKFGFLCPVADSKALAAAMKEAMCMDDKKRNELVAMAQRRVKEKYSHPVAVENLKRIYKDVYSRG